MKSYLKFLSRNKLYTFIELFGLSVSLAFTILIFAYALQENSVTKDEPCKKTLYGIGWSDCVGGTYGLGSALKDKFPEIVDFTRLVTSDGFYQNPELVCGDQTSEVFPMGIDSNFFTLFHCELVEGDAATAMATPNSVVLSESMARKLFGDEPAMGKSITVKYGEAFQLAVSGVMKDFQNRIFPRTDILVSLQQPVLFADVIRQPMDMFGFNTVFLKFAHPLNHKEHEQMEQKLLTEYEALFPGTWGKGQMLEGSTLTRLDELYFTKLSTNFRTGDEGLVRILFIAGLVLLACAIFNYINLTVAQTGFRAKEMATRQLVGATRTRIIVKFMGEALLFTIGCFLIGYFLAIGFSGTAGTLLGTTLDLTQVSTPFLLALTLLVILIALLSGLLPALMAARFKPIDIVKGAFRFKSKMVFGKVFITLQSVFSVVLVGIALTMYLQVRHLSERPLNYRTKDLLQIDVSQSGLNSSQARVLKNHLLQLSCVQRVGCYLGSPLNASGQGMDDKEGNLQWLRLVRVDSMAFDMFGFKVEEQFSDPLPGTIYFSREAMNYFQLKGAEDTDVSETLGKRCGINRICGVVEDYIYGDALHSPDKEHNAVALISDDSSKFWGLLVETTGPNKEAQQSIATACSNFMKELTGQSKELSMSYMDHKLASALKTTRNSMTMVLLFMGLSLLISMLGLLAMSTYYTRQRATEVAVRKVFGSETGEVTLRLSRSFMLQILIAIVIGTPLTISLATRWLSTFYDHISLPIGALVASALITFAVSLLAISWQVVKTARTNPIESFQKAE